MALRRSIDGSDGIPWQPLERAADVRPERRRGRSGRLAGGTVACPRCDAPVALPHAVAPSRAIGCPFCDHAGAVREFLSLAAPSRPARVEVRVVLRGPRRAPTAVTATAAGRRRRSDRRDA